MRTNGAVRALSALLMLLVVWLVGTGAAQAQFAQKRDTIKIDPSGFPADIKKGYRLFGMKCAECHGLDTSLQPTMSASQWPVEVKRMQAMPSAQFNDAQAKAIIDFLLYYEANRKSLNKSEDRVGASGAGGAGSQLYETQGCASCHALGGKGGTSGPSLTDVGKRLSKEQLTEVIRKGKSSMPPLPAGTTDEQLKELVNFLAGDNSQPQKQTAVPEKKQETPTSQETKPKAVAAPSETESKPTAEAGASAAGGAGSQLYQTQGCASCHALGGKGGTSGPSLTDVGKRLSREQLAEVIRKGKSSMPPLPAGTTEQQVKDLVDFLAGPNSRAQKQTAGVHKEPKTPTDQKSKPATQGEPSGNVVAAGLLGPQTGEGLARLQADDPNGPTALPGILLLFLIAVAAVLVSVLVFRPGLTATPGGKILAFLGLFILPLIAGWMGTTYHIDRSKSTTFCLSCHEMEPFGKSLLVDDPNHLAAAHFQNHRVPAGEACYTCHTNYAMFGGIRAKMGGLKHVYVHYLGTPPAPEAIRLYEPFNNRECLHCHLGARSFEEGATHNSSPYLLAALKGNQVSCLSCHKTVHDVAELNNAKFWKGVN